MKTAKNIKKTKNAKQVVVVLLVLPAKPNRVRKPSPVRMRKTSPQLLAGAKGVRRVKSTKAAPLETVRQLA